MTTFEQKASSGTSSNLWIHPSRTLSYPEILVTLSPQEKAEIEFEDKTKSFNQISHHPGYLTWNKLFSSFTEYLSKLEYDAYNLKDQIDKRPTKIFTLLRYGILMMIAILLLRYSKYKSSSLSTRHTSLLLFAGLSFFYNLSRNWMPSKKFALSITVIMSLISLKLKDK